MFGIAVWDGAAPARARARPARDQAPLPRNGGRSARVRVRAEGLLASGLVDVELDYAAIDAYLTLGYFPAPHDTHSPGSRSSCPGTRSWSTTDVTEEPFWRYPVPDPAADVRTRRGCAEQLLEQARRVRAAPADERRAARRDALRRARLEPDRRADGEAHDPAGQDVLGRIRGAIATPSSRTPARSRSISVRTTTSSSSRSTTPPYRSTSWSGTWTSRSPTSPRSASMSCAASRPAT